MKRIITANGRTFECVDVTTGIDGISFTMENQDASDVEAFFRDVTDLTTAFEGDETPRGFYSHLKFNYVTILENGNVSITMRIKNEIERRLDALEEEQEIQNGAIVELAQSIGA